MKKQLLSIILFSLLISSIAKVEAQNWAPVGATWYFEKNFISSSDVDYTMIEVEKDTVILGVTCSKLIGNFDACMWNSQYMYESNDSIYFYHPNNNKFELLFDFGASVGDVWKIPNYTDGFGLGNADTTELLVDSLGQVNVSGETLRVVYTSQINSMSSNFEFGGAIIERIGANYMFPSFFSCDPVPGNIRCYSDVDINYTTITFSCEAQSVGLSENNLDNIKIYPNPFHDYFEFSSDQEIKDIKLANLKGQNVLFEFKGNKIYPQNCSNGIYFLSFESNGMIYKYKLIKE